MSSRNVTYCLSRDLDFPFRVKITALEGSKQLLKESTKFTNPSTLKKLSNFQQNSDLFATAVVTLDGLPLTLPITTPYTSFRNSRKWNEWLELPIKVNQLPFTSKLHITLWEFDDSKRSIFGEAELNIFNVEDDCTLKRGRQKLDLILADNNTINLVKSTQPTKMDDLEKLIKKHENGDIISVDWLDNLTFRKIEQTNRAQSTDSQFLLFIDLVQFDIPVVFSDFKYPPPQIPTYIPTEQQPPLNQPKINTGKSSTLKIYDPEQYVSDPIEQKYRKLERSHKDGPLDRELKPTAKIRDELNKILNYSSVQELSQYEKNLVWKFRYFLINNKKGLNKLLKSINFSDETERKEALKLIYKWVEIDIEDALELLGPNFKDITVRTYAVERLKKAHDNELELYLLQLVQALKYESLTSSSSIGNSEYSIVELNESTSSSMLNASLSPLSQFLVDRALGNDRLGSFLYWYLNVESKDKPNSVYKQILDHYLKNYTNDGLTKEISLVDSLVKLCLKIKNTKDTTPKKIEALRSILDTKFKSFPPVKLPLDPSVEICGTISSESSVFKSSLSPLKITFKTTDGGEYPLMFKVGDDLRQDQLVIQIILLMNRLLTNENVDLKLTPYKILATGPTEGAIQFIPNSTLASVLAEYHGILPYLRHHHPDPNEELGVSDWVMDNFVKSCAGYCVITYILGVGDRHLDNLLICPDGHFFHADFGYILGQDPKPFPPLMKLPPQIIEAFGGASSPKYNMFRNYCFVSYSILRKNSNLILNLFEMMRDSSIPDITIEPDRAVYKVKEKFCLDMSEEEAIIHFQNLINDSVSALLPMVIDRLHSLAQYWRA
ncbi:Phosphatidylinositol 3-kinase catalytic subunit type 3 [Wickerhamomyces ciferrii]|uniref:Phosphatidylinositol 3-kinase VPS34 n=1 Tax=Wickerhamomyces ciferrii (strain ATCC 14091 / BCRC 22168 / CBS 111 / JCM 3599 / NBRC 0793 / NRRL Y-1031 F-60-10) TaxID=1206466 RepID=K0K9M2_WICCF|nr:Phosphatidylinositol 3-kinase catalytic subunit type 3 [Wickerhamomyces ciferrii]CCH41615.1 Phosphatidylinositol 3-kinase catalytic subunit type 3 [Wickerhamomyces ciferrii]